jgi:hypothetical protein
MSVNKRYKLIALRLVLRYTESQSAAQSAKNELTVLILMEELALWIYLKRKV